jgi:hypothetical protein
MIFELGVRTFNQRSEIAQRNMARLRDLGFRFSLDKGDGLNFDLPELQAAGVKFVKIQGERLLEELTPGYGNTRPKKNCSGSRRAVVEPVPSTSPMTTGTELTDASAASSARRGVVGTTTVNNTTHTATQERPSMPRWFSIAAGSANSAAAMA